MRAEEEEEEEEEGEEDETLREIKPFITRANEFQAFDLKTSYYCRLHALNIACKSTQLTTQKKKNKKVLEIIQRELEVLERIKGLNEIKFDKDLDLLHCERFAYTLFAKADVLDRKYQTRTIKVAKLYFVSANVFEVTVGMMKQEEDASRAEIEEKQRYALWRAGEISKAIRLGVECADPPAELISKTAFSGGTVDDDETEEEERLVEERAIAHSPPPLPPPSPPLSVVEPQQNKTTTTKGPPPGVGVGSKTNKVIGVGVHKSEQTKGNKAFEVTHDKRPDYEKLATAQAFAKSAVQALAFEDTKSAIEQLRKALEILEKN